MSAIRILLAQPWVERLGWTLVHFLWQGLAIAAVYAGARVSMKRQSPQCRYLLAGAALAGMLASPVATYSVLGLPQSTVATAPPATAAAQTAGSGMVFPLAVGENTPAGGTIAIIRPERVLPLLVILWFAGALAFSARLAGGWMAAARLRTQLVRAVPCEWEQALEGLRTHLRVCRPMRLLLSGLVEAPTVIGWLRPVVLVPVGLVAGLPAEHLEALLLHELAHIRRNDYLVNVLQSIVEALLFYHPAVWWISGHIRAERELCCDDLAVAVTGDAFTYGTALADLEGLRPAHLRSAVAAHGGLLVDRIARVLGQSRPESLTFSAPAAACAILLAMTACVVFGQSAARAKFEVASVKEVHEMRKSAGIRPSPGGRLIVNNYTVRGLIKFAYQLQDFQIVGGPNWLRNVGFDIEAKGGPTASREQLLLMLQPLLEERFHLRYHREQRELPVYALTEVKGGSKLATVKDGCVNAPTTPCGGLFLGPTASGMVARGGDVPMAELIRTLSMMLGRPVLDRTGIATHFDVNLEFAVDDTVPGFSAEFANVAGHNEMMANLRKSSDDAGAAPDILMAVQQQLGLKLDATRGSAEVMVIDSVEKPDGN